ncbi:hypothetical protein B296_00048051 [Ensete ventricosum]|uniref:Uncharacterized protein n=1 Tax=Ensete ventricosum TaxID=4639 RepID=A0A426XUN9_ENSVE|nr:hypothetical protein B296_00048051 [Ensete ventricosum]
MFFSAVTDICVFACHFNCHPHPRPDFPFKGHDQCFSFFSYEKNELKTLANACAKDMYSTGVGSSHTYMYVSQCTRVGVVHISFCLVAESRGRSAEAQEPHAPYRGTPHLITMSNRTKRRPPPDLSDGDEIPHPRLPKAIPGGSKPPHASLAVVAVPAGGTKKGKICMAEMKHPFLSTNSKRKKETSGSSLKPQDRPSLSPAKNKQKLVIADISNTDPDEQMEEHFPGLCHTFPPRLCFLRIMDPS